jgi:hypothetical protein
MVGDYTLTLSLPGYATTTKTITITEGKTEKVNETLVITTSINPLSSALSQTNIPNEDTSVKSNLNNSTFRL